MNKDIVKNIKVLIVFFSICFFSIIAYLTYFNLQVADRIKNSTYNKRVRLAEEETIRGSILDRNGEVIAYSENNGKNQKRIYKDGEAFAHVTGYNSFIYGKTGIESAYNDVLIGRVASYDVVAAFFRTIKEELTEKDKRGGNVCLTLDRDTQEAAYRVMGNDRGAVAAVNPSTGEVLALVSKPSFDPEGIDKGFEKYKKNEEGKPFVNRAAQGYYPPGSVFKIVTAAAALEDIPNIRKQAFNCNGKLKIGNYILTDHKKASHGRLDIKNAFRLSCNYTFGSIGIELGYKNLEKTAEKFMFNREIPSADEFDVLNVKNGVITIGDEKSKALTAQDAIGQHGVTTNPLHMALVAAAAANGGIMMEPYIVKDIRDRYGVVMLQTKPQKLSEAMSSVTADTIKEYMVQTVKSGTGTAARISGITVAGKTGSAENTAGEETHSWFVAFAPAEKPEIAVAVIVENAGRGGGRAAEIARETIKAYLRK